MFFKGCTEAFWRLALFLPSFRTMVAKTFPYSECVSGQSSPQRLHEITVTCAPKSLRHFGNVTVRHLKLLLSLDLREGKKNNPTSFKV